MTIQDYLDLITSEYATQPNFLATVSADVSPMVRVQDVLVSMLPIFDLSLPPVGNQLDIIGQWVGISRNITVPITGVYFSWDSSDTTLGWDVASWQPVNAPNQIIVLPDFAYLTLIQAKIAANHWDGTTEGAYAVWAIAFPDLNILIQDNQDMSYLVIILGDNIPTLTLALLTGGYIQLKPEGVAIVGYFTGEAPVFGWDLDTEFFKGWDTGSWAKEIAPGG